MRTAIELATPISMLVIIVTIIYMYYRHKTHHMKQSHRMHEFNSLMTKEIGVPYKDPKTIEEERKKFFEDKLEKAAISFDAERVTLYCGESGLIPIKYFVWRDENQLMFFPTKEVLKEKSLLLEEMTILRVIKIEEIISCSVIKTDDVIEELQEMTELSFNNNKGKDTMTFKSDDLLVFQLIIPEKLNDYTVL